MVSDERETGGPGYDMSTEPTGRGRSTTAATGVSGRGGIEYLEQEIMSDLSSKQCVSCRGGVPPLSSSETGELLRQIEGWTIDSSGHLSMSREFPDFCEALAFVNAVGAIAEEQGHHPDLYLSWGLVRVELWTHKINGLTESDFILAAKIDAVAGGPTE